MKQTVMCAFYLQHNRLFTNNRGARTLSGREKEKKEVMMRYRTDKTKKKESKRRTRYQRYSDCHDFQP